MANLSKSQSQKSQMFCCSFDFGSTLSQTDMVENYTPVSKWKPWAPVFFLHHQNFRL